MKKEMLINVLQPEECRIAIVEDGLLEELYVERASQESYVGNIYKGRIVNLEPSIQAAFVDFGIGRNGFLHVSDVDPAYYRHLLPKDVRDRMDAEDAADAAPKARGGRDRGDRGDRGDRRDRGPRLAAPESSVTVPAGRSAPAPAPAGDDEDEDDGFGEGLIEGDDQPPADEGDEADGFAAADDDAAEEEGIVEGEVVSEVEVRRTVTAAPPPPPRPAPPPPPRPAPVEEDEDDGGFGEGLDLDDAPPAPPVPPAAATVEVEAPAVEEPAAEPVAEPEPEPEAEKKPRARRGKKKADAEPAADGDGGEPPADAGPRVMGGAERRTSAGDDEPEIKPFFDGADDFDVEGENDRFGGSPRNAAADDDEAEGDEEASAGFADAEEEDADAEPAPRAERVEVNYAGGDVEDDEFAPPRRTDDDEGGRGRGGRGRGGRDRDRGDRDRGPRGDRGGPRGDRGDRGGPRRAGGDRGGPPPRDRGYPRPPIQEIFKRGQEVIVQVIKDGIGTKGPTLSTFISIAGRYLVLMPSLGRVGVSRKIEDMDARRRLRDIMNGLNPPKGVGFIVRTAAIDRNETELRNDLTYLLRLWQVVVRRIKRVAAPVEIYRESDMITRTIRDIFTNDIETIYVDEEKAFAHASEFLQIVMPRFAGRIRYYGETEPLFHKYRVEEEIAKINQRRLDLPGGGSIIIEQTEALVAIDVNSGTFRAENNAEETAFQMNLRAAKEIARQLRLRDLGGVIVNDFIDMRSESHRRKVEDAMQNALKRDRARTKILRISQFGIIEMTRQRIQPSLKKRIFNECSHCNGTGYVKNQETMGIEAMRLLQLAAHRTPVVSQIALNVHPDVAFYLLNRKRKEIAALEERAKMEVTINGQFGAPPELCEAKCYDANGNEVRLQSGPPPRMVGGGGRFPRLQERRPQNLD